MWYIKVTTFEVSVAFFVDFEQHFSNFLALKRATYQDFMSTICQGLTGGIYPRDLYLEAREHEGTERETEGVGCDMS